MSTGHHGPDISANGGLKPFSCQICRLRKVRCDRRWPCSNCVRASSDCDYVAPVRGKRRRMKAPREGLHAKLRRYEEMLRARGVSIDDAGGTYGNIPGEEQGSDGGLSVGEGMDSPASLPVMTPGDGEHLRGRRPAASSEGAKLVHRDGALRYYENSTLWSSIGDDFRHPDEFSTAEEEEFDAGEVDLVLGGGSCRFRGRLCNYHPPAASVSTLMGIYIDRIDPLVKILHIPSFTPMVLAAAKAAEMEMDKEAAVFCWYFSTVSVMDEQECVRILGEGKEVLFAKYRAIARHTLGRARLLSTTSLMTLHAFYLFLMAMRQHLRHDAQHILCGIGLRLAQKMGLHRDGKVLGLSIFDTEMRRRLWWHAVHLDFRTADMLGTRPSQDIYVGDAGLPFNCEDSDLNPTMEQPPSERKAITPITMCLVRCDLAASLQRLSGKSSTGASWGSVGTNTTLTTAEKDALIDEMENASEMRYLRYCDPSRSLDVLVSCMIRAALCNMRLYAHNPRLFAHAGDRNAVPPAERDIAFHNATKLLEYASLVGENSSLRKYEWRINTTYLWDKILYVLIEARHRKLGPEVDRIWELMGRVFRLYPGAFGRGASAAVYKALSRWTMEVWGGYVRARRDAGMQEAEEPVYIKEMKVRESGGEVVNPNSATEEKIEKAGREGVGFVDEFSGLEDFEMNVDEWMNWEQLISGQNHLEGEH